MESRNTKQQATAKEGTTALSSRKRKFLPNPGSHKLTRGGPAVLLTCETGREHKCKMQGLDILKYYLSVDDGTAQDDTSLSLEDELKRLQESNKDAQKKKLEDFSVYETGCRGSVFMMCTMKSCQLIPPIQTEYMKAKKTAESNDSVTRDDGEEGTTEPETKKPRHEETKKSATNNDSNDNDKKKDDKPTVGEPPWDPIETVRRVFDDNIKKSTGAPSSRFITRMIPIQATCYASIEEVTLTTQSLLEKYLPSETKKFAVEIKRRHGNKTLSRDKIIEIVVSQVTKVIPNCKVDLTNPDVTIIVEVCQTLCGISVIQNYASFRKFNLVIARENAM